MGKLVRDKIPEIIRANGEEPVFRILDNAEFKVELEKKLEEECAEALEASGGHRLEELADILEVLRALAMVEGANLDAVIQLADKKAIDRGAFSKQIFIEQIVSRS